MRLFDLFEHLFSMSDYAEIKPLYDRLVEHLRSLSSARISVDKDQMIVKLHTDFEHKPLVISYKLISNSSREFQSQLAAAYRSLSKGAAPTADVADLLQNSTLRAHALNFLTNPKRWHTVGFRFAGQNLPVPPSDARPMYKKNLEELQKVNWSQDTQRAHNWRRKHVGKNIEINFSAGSRDYTVRGEPMFLHPRIYTVDFFYVDENLVTRWDVTGAGSAEVVLPLVAHSVLDIALHPDCEGIFFTAKLPALSNIADPQMDPKQKRQLDPERGRRNLYNRLVRSLADKLGWQTRPDLAAKISRDEKNQGYLVIDPEAAKALEAEQHHDEKSNQALRQQGDSFAAAPVRFGDADIDTDD